MLGDLAELVSERETIFLQTRAFIARHAPKVYQGFWSTRTTSPEEETRARESWGLEAHGGGSNPISIQKLNLPV